MAEITRHTISAAWDATVALIEKGRAQRLATRFGVTFDLPGLSLVIANPADLSQPTTFQYPQLVADYSERLFGADRAVSLIYNRLRRWPSEQGTVDQLKATEDALRQNETTRGAVYGLWDGAADPYSSEQVSPVAGGFRIIDGSLHHFVTARSVDILVGLVPELIAFARIQQDLAARLSLSLGALHYCAWSAHVYEFDYVAYVWAK